MADQPIDSQNLAETVQNLERRFGELSSIMSANKGGELEAVTHREFERLVAPVLAYNERLEQQLRATQGQLALLVNVLNTDATLATAFTQAGLQVSSTAISSLDAAKLTGDVAQARLTTNVLGALNAVSGSIDTDLLQTNVIAAVNASSGGGDYGKFNTGNISTSGTAAVGNTTITGTAQVSSTLTAQGSLVHTGSTAGFFNTAAASQQAVPAQTNNITSGGSANTFADYTLDGIYANAEATIRNNQYRLGEAVRLCIAALRTYGLLG